MAKKKEASDDDDDEDRKQEQPLQAVLLADDWAATPHEAWGFQPLLLDRPKILCPLLDRPLIDYTLSYLASQNVAHVVVVCVTQQVEEYILESSAERLNLQLTVIRDTTVSNAGDALRELDKRSLITSDPFILLHNGATTITNCDLTNVLQAHKERKAADSTAIMTMLLQESRSSSSSSCLNDLVMGVDPHQSNRILLYDNSPEHTQVVMPCSFFSSHCTELTVYTNLVDAGIDICSPDVLLKFSDEFDYRQIRSQFVVNAVAEEEEGLQNKLYAHFVTDPTEYIGCCSDIRTFHETTRNVLRRHAYPVVPPLPMQRRNYLYMPQDVRLGRSSTIVGPGLLGSSVIVGEQCTVTRSVISNHAHISDGCVITDAHLWEGVQVEGNVTIQQSILGAGVVVRSGATIPRGCVIGAGCIIGTNVTLPEYTRLTCAASTTEDDFEDGDEDWSSGGEADDDDDATPEMSDPAETTIVSQVEIVGSDGLGRVWKPSPDDIDEDYYLSADLILRSQCIGFDPEIVKARTLAIQAEDDGGAGSSSAMMTDGDNDALVFGSAAPMIIGRQEGVDVIKELKAICLEYEDTSPIENLAIELNSYKFSQNATYSDCTLAATLAIIEKMEISKTTKDGKLVADFKNLLGTWKPLLQKMSIGLDEEKAVIVALQQSALSEELSPVLSTGMSFRFLLQTLHDEEIVSEESILSWVSDPESPPSLVEMEPVKEFIEWLQEDDSDEDDDSDEESE